MHHSYSPLPPPVLLKKNGSEKSLGHSFLQKMELGFSDCLAWLILRPTCYLRRYLW